MILHLGYRPGHLYEKHGFALSRTQRGSQWGKEVNEQLFTLGGV